MDAPPGKEDCRPYLDITARLQACGVTVPEILDHDPGQGFLLLSDLGTVHYLDRLAEDNADQLYGLALEALARIQRSGNTRGLPLYDDTLLIDEIQLFTDWLLGKHLGIRIDGRDHARLQEIFETLVDSAHAQPQVFVHRDYHSRNLMVMEKQQETPGILDFQDAVTGPASYDLVSLLKDCYIKWPRERIREWATDFHQACFPDRADGHEFLRRFDLMGVQRHLKASGIFARLYHRDGKPGYLEDIPRTLSYVTDLSEEYPELRPLIELIQQRMLPLLGEANAGCMP